MKKFNNTLAGTDCGDAGLPSHSGAIAKAKTVLRVIPKTPDICAASTHLDVRQPRRSLRTPIALRLLLDDQLEFRQSAP
jgi:hypothetical protein